jgi:hypothetical protein
VCVQALRTAERQLETAYVQAVVSYAGIPPNRAVPAVEVLPPHHHHGSETARDGGRHHVDHGDGQRSDGQNQSGTPRACNGKTGDAVADDLGGKAESVGKHLAENLEGSENQCEKEVLSPGLQRLLGALTPERVPRKVRARVQVHMLVCMLWLAHQGAPRCCPTGP